MIKEELEDRIWSSSIMRHYVEYAKTNYYIREVKWIEIESRINEAKRQVRATDINSSILFSELNQVTFGKSNKLAVAGYAGKNIGELKISEDITSIEVTIQEVVKASGTENSDATENSCATRRLPLTIPNYSKIIINGELLTIAGIRSIGLAHQFALALQVMYPKKKVNLVIPNPLPSKLIENYERLKKFFQKANLKKRSINLVFGYQKAFENINHEKIVNDGWVGYVIEYGEEIILALDSDTMHSYHVEVLAENVKNILKDDTLSIKRIFVGGSAGSLLPPKQSGKRDLGLEPYSIFTPFQIETTVPYERIPNALRKWDTMIPRSTHKSVLSVFTESPLFIKDLQKRHIYTLDMEFGYLAEVLSKHNKRFPEKAIEYGIALLVTDYPATHSEEKLNEKGNKQNAQKEFVRLVLNAIPIKKGNSK